MRVESQFLFLGRGDEGFLENYSYELEEDPEGKGGQIFMTLEILNNDADAEEIGEALFSNMKQVFYEDLEKSPYDRFEEAIKKANATIIEFRAEKASRFIGNLNILIATRVGKEFYLTQTGDAEGYLVRKRYVSVISEGLGEEREGEEAFTNIASGVLEDGDVILLSSSRLLRYITKNDLAKFLTIPGKGKTLQEALAFLQDYLLTEILGRAALIGLHIETAKAEIAIGEGESIEAEAKAVSLPGWLERFTAQKHVRRFFEWGKRAGKIGRLTERKLPSFSLYSFTRDRILVALVLVIVVLLAGIIGIRVKGGNQKVIREQEAKLTQVQELISDAATKGQFDREKGAVLLKKAEEEALAVLNSRYLRSKAARLLDEIQKQRGLLDNVKLIENPQVFVDLYSKKSDVKNLGLLFLKDRLFAFDEHTLFEILLDRLQEPKSLVETDSVILGTAFPDQEALVFLTRTGKVVEYQNGQARFMDTADRIWKKGVSLKAYNDKIYILDPERNQIWRYRRKREAYDIGEGINIDGDLRNAATFAIDASVYVISKDGKLSLFYTGKKQNVPIQGSPFSPLLAPTKMYTDVDLAQLFILEPSQKRVVTYLKDRRQGGNFPSQLVYQNQYVFKNIGELRDLYVSKDEGKLYVADESKIYVTSL